MKDTRVTKVTWATHWVDRFGTPILFTAMGNHHLCATLEMLYRHSMGSKQLAISASRESIKDMTGIVKRRATQRVLTNKHDMEFIHPAFPGLYQEAKNRGLLDILSFPLWIE